MRQLFFDPEKLPDVLHEARPTKTERQLISDCRAQLKKCLGLSDGQLFMTGSAARGTALRGALDFDVVVVWKSAGREAVREIETLLCTTGSGFEIDDKLRRGGLVFARFNDIELDIAPRSSKFRGLCKLYAIRMTAIICIDDHKGNSCGF